MKTLFLGSSGFIGRSLLDSLQDMEDVTVLRRDTCQKPKGLSKIVYGSLDDPETLSILARGKFDRVIDSSWFGLPNRDSINNKKNLQMKKRLIETLGDSRQELVHMRSKNAQSAQRWPNYSSIEHLIRAAAEPSPVYRS